MKQMTGFLMIAGFIFLATLASGSLCDGIIYGGALMAFGGIAGYLISSPRKTG